jgi:hypothetical protein
LRSGEACLAGHQTILKGLPIICFASKQIALSWFAVRKENTGKFVEHLQLTATGEFEEIPESLKSIGRTSCQILIESLYPGLRVSDRKCHVSFRHPNPADLSKSVVSYSRIEGFKRGF